MIAFTPIIPNTVFVAKPVEMSYAEAMRGLCMWLDHNKIQPADFKIVVGGRIGFEFIFSTACDALAFNGFEWLHSEVEQSVPHFVIDKGIPLIWALEVKRKFSASRIALRRL